LPAVATNGAKPLQDNSTNLVFMVQYAEQYYPDFTTEQLVGDLKQMEAWRRWDGMLKANCCKTVSSKSALGVAERGTKSSLAWVQVTAQDEGTN
jgi:hypothetical protein